MKTYILHHDQDIDGIFSGCILLKSELQKNNINDIIVIGYDYGRPLPEFESNSRIIMADVSIPLMDFKKLSEEHEILHIDHHISFIKEYEKYVLETKDDFMETYYYIGKSACELCWEHCFGDVEKMPPLIKLAGDYDVWRNKPEDIWENIVMPIQYWMRATYLISTPIEIIAMISDNLKYDLFSSKEVPIEFFYMGQVAKNNEDIQNIMNFQKNCFTTKFLDFNVICMNTPRGSTSVFEKFYNPDLHDLMVTFCYNGKRQGWNIGLYSIKEIDVSSIAKQFGGGGHYHASGFFIKELKQVLNL